MMQKVHTTQFQYPVAALQCDAVTHKSRLFKMPQSLKSGNLMKNLCLIINETLKQLRQLNYSFFRCISYALSIDVEAV